MFIIFGTRKLVKEFGTRAHSCGRCNNTSEYKYVRVRSWFSLFFIPVIPYETTYGAYCTICGNMVKFKKTEFDKQVETLYVG